MATKHHPRSGRFICLGVMPLLLAAGGCATQAGEDPATSVELSDPYEPKGGGAYGGLNGSPGVSETMLDTAFSGSSGVPYSTIGTRRSTHSGTADYNKVDISTWAAGFNSTFLSYLVRSSSPDTVTEFFRAGASVGYADKILSAGFNYVDGATTAEVAKIWETSMLFTNSNTVSIEILGSSVHTDNDDYYVDVPYTCAYGDQSACMNKGLYQSGTNTHYSNYKKELALIIDTSADCTYPPRPRVTAFISPEVADILDEECWIDVANQAEAKAAVAARICSSTAYGAEACDDVVKAVYRMDQQLPLPSTAKYCSGSTSGSEKDKIACKTSASATPYDVVYTMIYIPHVIDLWCQ